MKGYFEWWKYSHERFYIIGVGRKGLMRNADGRFLIRENPFSPEIKNLYRNEDDRLIQMQIQIDRK